ncbi:MAG: Gfo/Idh/MocA family oxidoreductase [Armatimonadetes bacterium]|nr:Gfo/Idh/MocA family oxidoreductase [Armatimonadota bacterium]
MNQKSIKTSDAGEHKISRRGFLGKATAAAAATYAIPTLIPSGVLAANGQPGANDRLVMGYIGVGGMGTGHVREDDSTIGAICDVDENHLQRAAKRATKSTPFLTKDYRRILDRDDIDAVFVATPDHWHALQMVHACQAGKDVYTEKPTCKTVEEGQAMINAAKRYNRVVQVGAQGRSTAAGHVAATYVRNGQLGRVSRVEVWHPDNMGDGWGENQPPPDHLDWDMWLGPMRWREYNPAIAHFNFRWLMDSGGGFIRDRGNHALNIVSWAVGLDHKHPVSVEATGDPYVDSIYDAPKRMQARWEFKDPDVVVTWEQPGNKHGIEWGERFVGDKDTLLVSGGDGGCDTEQKAKQYTPPANGVHLQRSTNHRQNWIDCIKTREEPISNITALVNVVYMPILALISYRVGRKLQWDAANLQFVGDAEANRLLREPYRGTWSLG